MTELWIGLGISFIIATLALFKNSLSRSGYFGALIFGTFIYYWGGVLVWSVLIAFFISSSILTKLHAKQDQDVPKKGRTLVQVMANALVATVFSGLYYYLHNEIFLLAAVVSIATSNADTWASEIGALSKGITRYIVSFKIAPKGASGAISKLGTFASLFGALFIALIFNTAYAVTQTIDVLTYFRYLLIITVGGFLGCFIDSYLGALIQAKYKGEKSGKLTERRWLPDEGVILISGFTLITNDVVNLLASLFSSIITLFIVL